MKNIKVFSIFNFVFLIIIGSYMSYYGLAIGDTTASYIVSLFGALLIGYAIHSTAIIHTSHQNKNGD